MCFVSFVFQVSKHKQYLDTVCEDFFSRISHMIEQAETRQSHVYTGMTSEILQHFHLGRGRCEVFEGRDDVIETAREYLNNNSGIPLTIYGKSGCGKTSVMAKILEQCCEGHWVSPDGKPYAVLVRFLGTTPQTSNLYQLLDSLCGQLSVMCGRPWVVPEKFKDLVKSFVDLLRKAGKKQRIVVLLDSIDQLMPAHNAYKMTWLPDNLPSNVKMIISTIPEGYPVLGSMRERCVPHTRGLPYFGLNV